MKKIDKLIFKAFIGPFILTLCIVVFILLIQQLLRYMDQIIGKDLGTDVYAELFLNFAYVTTPMALPLAILLSSIMTFGNLGQHFELTAIKGAGISLVRALLPIFIFSVFLSVAAYYSNYYLVPRAALNAYSLLWDVKQKKPSMELKEGVFYNGIPNYSIKINGKDDDRQLLKDLMIYDHSAHNGNISLTVADSGRMISINEGRYLKLEMFNGARYADGESNKSILKRRRNEPADFIKTEFEKTYFIFDLSSMTDMKRTDKDLFARNRIMRNREQLLVDVDSIRKDVVKTEYSVFQYSKSFFLHHGVNQELTPDYLEEQIKYYDSLEDLRKKEVKIDSSQIAKKNAPADSLADNNSKRIKEDDLPILIEDSVTLKNRKEERDKESTNRPGSVVANKEISGDLRSKLDSIRDSKRIRDRQSRSRDLNVKSENEKGKEELPAESDTNKVDTSDYDIAGDETPISLPEKKSSKNSVEDNLEKFQERIDSEGTQKQVIRRALTRARQNKGRIEAKSENIKEKEAELRAFIVEYNKKFAMSFACIIMFLIGAPLGSIIKKGGLGFPTIVSVIFFIIYYVLSIFGEKWGKEEVLDPTLGAWMANIILFPLGIYFLQQARVDARLFDADFYSVAIKRLKKKFFNK
ncbi:LptF/LptG family permease [Mangrovivirga sp. M17]|uniref:LptF/LptG family permease n=1 Tax=Mangrovivirga halotolerans TaxID=2993936 RepID=A0ABT3RRC5_9BACT|nr:LptF/LptG family permease [Mangrovivirga halotolerans]MCX2744338.1 LptF/LptG family permease [Mangrovivirga halotolerans]